MKSFLLIFTFLFSLCDLAIGSGLNPSATVDGTGILPKGIFSPRIRHYNSNIDNKINDQRISQPLAESVNRKVSWQQMLETRKGFEKDLMKASLEAMGLDLSNGGPGAIAADVNVGLNVSVPILTYGLTDKASIGLIVPVYQVQTSLAQSFVASEQGKAWMNSISSPSTKAQAKAVLENALVNTLKTMGYSGLNSESFTALGDIQITYKRLLYKLDKHSIQWKNFLVTPTGQEPNADKIIDVPTGDGQWDISTGFVYQYDSYLFNTNIKSRYVLNTSYTHQFADSIEKRIPTEEGNFLSSDKEKVERKLGDQMQIGVGFVLGNTSDGSSMGMSYDYQYSLANKYSGNKFTANRYSWLEDLEGESELESLTLAYSYSTIEAYRRKQFRLPLTATLSIARPLSGKNVNDVEIYFGELIVYF